MRERREPDLVRVRSSTFWKALRTTCAIVLLALLSIGCEPEPDDVRQPADVAPPRPTPEVAPEPATQEAHEPDVDDAASSAASTPPSASEPATAANDIADAESHRYTGATKCRSCHKKKPIGNQYAVWEQSKHATALETLGSDKAREWADEAGVADPQTDDRCVKCHITAHDVPADLLGLKYKREEGVSCEACHGAGWDYKKKKIMIDRDLAIEKGLVPQTEAVCVRCHNDESPAWDPERYQLAGGSFAGFDYEQAVEAIAHPVPEDYDPMAEGEAE